MSTYFIDGLCLINPHRETQQTLSPEEYESSLADFSSFLRHDNCHLLQEAFPDSLDVSGVFSGSPPSFTESVTLCMSLVYFLFFPHHQTGSSLTQTLVINWFSGLFRLQPRAQGLWAE